MILLTITVFGIPTAEIPFIFGAACEETKIIASRDIHNAFENAPYGIANNSGTIERISDYELDCGLYIQAD